MLTHPVCSPSSPRGWLKCPEEVMYTQLGALEMKNENILDGVSSYFSGKMDVASFVLVCLHAKGADTVETPIPYRDTAIALRIY